MDPRPPLIFTHYGNSDYLLYTLKQAKHSNPDMTMVLIGDESNRDVAQAAAWHHVNLLDYQSRKRNEFNARFRWVQGNRHHPIKGGKDWLRFVFERFFIIEEYLRLNRIEWYWHFDSDTMILHKLSPYEDKIRYIELDCTTLCNDTCPSGLISYAVTRDYCSHIIDSFKNEKFLASQQREFDEVNPQYAYTEMRAFANYRSRMHPKTRHLASLFAKEMIWFDDCICQDNGFAVFWADRLGRPIKDLYSSNGAIMGIKNGTGMTFATLNCSWVPIDVFRWVQQASMSDPSTPASIKSYISFSVGGRAMHVVGRIFHASKMIIKSIFSDAFKV